MFDTLPITQRKALLAAIKAPLRRTRGGYQAEGTADVHTVRCINALERADLVQVSEDHRVVTPTDVAYRMVPVALQVAA